MIPIDLSPKRAKLALRFFTYGVMTLATIILTALAIFYAMGYRFNRDTLSFVQGGLVQFNSVPAGATIVIDGRAQSYKTPGRANLGPGQHTIGLQLDGYRSWQKTVDLGPGQLLWLNYTRLIPNSVTTVPLKSFDKMHALMASPDRRWLAIQQRAGSPRLTIVDTGDERNLKYDDITIPDSKLTKVGGKLGAFTLVEWDLGSRYLLIHHHAKKINEWLRVDRTAPENTINLTQQFRSSLGDVHFAGPNSNQLYAITDKVLRRLDVPAGSMSAALVTGVKQYSVYGDGSIAFVAERNATAGNSATKQQIAGIYRRDKEVDVETIATGVPVKIAFGEYANHVYLAIYKGKTSIQILRDPSPANIKDISQFAALEVGQAPSQMMFSNNGRMVVAGANNQITTYDLEIGATYKSMLSFLSQKPVRPLNWLDDYYLWSDNGDRLRIVEFDGQNDREITSLSAGFSVSLSETGKTLFSIGQNGITNKYFLQASRLVND